MPTSSHSMKIGNITFDRYPVFLAPMEDVTDPAFRLVCKEFGADLVYTEFVSADALVRFVNRTMQKLTIVDEERPVAIQIYGKDPQTMVDAAKIVAESNPDIIDINFGCPVKKIASKGAGAGLLICTLARQLQDCGIAALAIHGRTRSQMYTGEADWTLIGEVKNDPKIKIPIIGNGDITTPEVAEDKFHRYGVDAIMVGRGAIGNAWIFAEIKNRLLGENRYSVPNFESRKEILKRHIINSIEWLKDERKGIIHSRRHIAATPIFKGIPNFKPTRIAMLKADSISDLFALIDGGREV